MKLLPYLLPLLLASAVASAQTTAQYPFQPVPFQQVELRDNFWLPRLETIRQVTIPVTFKKNEETGRLKNFDIAAGKQSGSFCTTYAFDDSDVYKSIEGAAYALQRKRDPRLEAQIDSIIARIAAAQETDGYLYTWRTIAEKRKSDGSWNEQDERNQNLVRADDQRWSKEDHHSHETYNAGHLYEAAVAWKNATGKTNLMDIALKNAELVLKSFGPGKLEKAPGHQEVELGLVKLYLATGDRRFLDQAKFFLHVRGYGEPYMQNHKKLKDQREAVGHAVRAGYMFSAAADVTAYSGDTTFLTAMKAVWEDIVGKKMYITGGVGSTGSNEGFSTPYDLPNYSAYCETCSSIAFAMWNQRMFQLTGESRYVDILERTLYNALNAGLSLSGDLFFYPNPLESRKNVERVPWFTCACCPPNVTRFFSFLPGYMYAKHGNELYVNLYAANKTQVENINSVGQKVLVDISQETTYPWDGLVRLRIDPAKPNTFTLKLRIPGWAKGDAVPFDLYRFNDDVESNIVLKINNQIVAPQIRNGYAVIERKWQKGDVVEINLPMVARRVRSSDFVEADQNRYAIQRGPLVYCLEGKDQPDDRVLNMIVPDTAAFRSRFEPKLLGGVQTLSFTGYLVHKKISAEMGELQAVPLKAIPYYAWANRGKDNMAVWLPYDLRGARPLAQRTIVAQSKYSASEGVKGALEAVGDQYSPRNSNDQENPFVHWWPHFGTTEWLQLDFARPEQVGTARVYWFDDESTGGGCRVPASWRILYLENGEWKPVYAPAGYKVTKDGWDEVQFEPVKTGALRLEMTLKEGVSSGVHEIEIK